MASGQASRRQYFFSTTTETSLVPSGDTLCALPNNSNGFFQRMPSELGLGLWFNNLGPSDEIQRSQHRIGV